MRAPTRIRSPVRRLFVALALSIGLSTPPTAWPVGPRAAAAAKRHERARAALDKKPSRARLTRRFDRALVFAEKVHRKQRRKVGGQPYFAHLLQVAGLVLEAGGGEREAIAGLLHDAVEDQGGPKTLKKIHKRFGRRVARIVKEVSDDPNLGWREVRQAKIDAVAAGKLSDGALLVKLADNLHNVRSMIGEHIRYGEKMWATFDAGRDGAAWYFRSMVAAYHRGGVDNRLLPQLERAIEELFGDEE